mgnify:CR=1 FL=1
MRPSETLPAFVEAALRAGHSRSAVSAELLQAGWSRSEVDAALGHYADTHFAIPVPVPQPVLTAGEALVYGLTLVTLTATVWHLANLGFDLIDRLVPDPSDRGTNTFRLRSIRFSMAVLIVAVPVFSLLDLRMLRRLRDRDVRRRSLIRTWFGNVTLFAAILTILGALIAAIYNLLTGDDPALRVLLKSGLVVLLGAVVALYGRRDAYRPSDEA